MPMAREMPAHPRSRGENELNELIGISDQGSSPLTRGKQPSPPSPCTATRLIPAHAGKTVSSALHSPASTAHPRSRGENRVIGSPLARLDGSSPLTRGKPSTPVGQAFAPRLIPAHAGKTRPTPSTRRRRRAHPRSRGENYFVPSSGSLKRSSSPLTRGKPCMAERRYLRSRLIPAHAGKTAGF